MYGITFNKHVCSLKVALALDALYFGKQCGKGSTKLLIIGYLYISLAIKLYKPYSRRIVVECPTCNKRTVAHMSLFYLIAWLYAGELRKQTIHHIRIILRAISLERRS